ncbi:hypothetical protein BBI08_10980 [Planococcus halocryophilus]|uniref:Uncharacterized protein n=1 Tax=Planococcus halocryophilus TaxID=1215089 RepID=A0A1C7DSP5_9BACL|nr:hypothetical protein BBI08_10980 [Planococcus halocryophilus]
MVADSRIFVAARIFFASCVFLAGRAYFPGNVHKKTPFGFVAFRWRKAGNWGLENKLLQGR